MTDQDAPDFEALRAKRNAAMADVIEAAARSMGWTPEEGPVQCTFDPSACYCDCANGGPCEHVWGGWRETHLHLGGEAFCQKCGMGATHHSLANGP